MNSMGMRKKIWIRIAIIGMIVLAVVVYIIRFQSLNQLYAIGTCRTIEYGESDTDHEIEYKISSFRMINATEYVDLCHSDLQREGLESTDLIGVVTLCVTNHSNEEQSLEELFESVLLCGNWSNGIGFELDPNFEGVIAAGQTIEVTMCTTINLDLKTIYKTGTDWKLRIKGWPNRIELLCPQTNENEGEK